MQGWLQAAPLEDAGLFEPSHLASQFRHFTTFMQQQVLFATLMMPLTLKLRSFFGKEVTSPSCTHSKTLSGKPDRPLEFWYIKPHDRETLICQIMPYMAGRLRKRHLPRAVLDRHGWTEEFVEDSQDESAWFRQTTTAFQVNPATMVADLLELTRLWFFMLLRYTYRRRFFKGREMSRSDLDVRHLYTNLEEDYIAELTEDEVYHLTRLQNKYGASFYRISYKDAKKRLDWTKFCKRIRSFCQSIGLYVLSQDPEKNLQELRKNLTSIILHQKLQCIRGDLAKDTVLVRSMRKDVKNLVKLDAVHNNTARVMKREIQEMNYQLEGLLQKDVEISAELVRLRTAYDDRSKVTDCDILQENEISKKLIPSIQSKLKRLPNEPDRLHTRQENYITADALVLCRWLLEHLPAGNPKHERLGYHWKLFWQSQWDECRKKKRENHPLRELVDHEKYNRIGKCLYSTLSNRLHQYGLQRGDILHPDVQRVLHVIGPLHYDDSGKVNLQAEKRRWTG